MGFPAARPRRLRGSPLLRRMVRETTLSPSDFIQPFFVRHGRGVRRPAASMPGVEQPSVAQPLKAAGEVYRLGIPAVILFGLPAAKDPMGREAYAADGIVQRATRALKDALPE